MRSVSVGATHNLCYIARMTFKTSLATVKAFADMGLPDVLITALRHQKISIPTTVQSMTIPLAMERKDLIAVAETGSGKTLAYALPTLAHLALEPDSRALVLVPNREMAQQIHKVCKDLAKEIATDTTLIIGGKGTGTKQSNQLRKKPRMIIATPGRLNDHLISNKLLLQGVNIVVIDEADRMLDMGFAPQLLAIRKTIRGKIQVMMFSASFHKNVETIAKAFLQPDASMIKTEKSESPVRELKQTVIFIERSQKLDRLLDELNATTGGVIVYTGNQESCEQVGHQLAQYGYSSAYLHGSLTQGQRNRVMRSFITQETRILICTDILARGIDISHVETVINFDLPFQREDFLHRIGRTARAGKSGNAITFISEFDQKSFLKIKDYLGKAKEIVASPGFVFRTKLTVPKKDNRQHPSQKGKIHPTKQRKDSYRK